MYYVLCIMYYVLCIMYYVLCIMYDVRVYKHRHISLYEQNQHQQGQEQG
jgi:hypothetical protein